MKKKISRLWKELMSRPDDYRSEPRDYPDDEIEDYTADNDDDNQEEGREDLSRKYVLGLDVDEETSLPRVTSMGRGRLAEKLLSMAEEAGAPVDRDPELVEKMFSPKDQRVIPARTYRVIAEILTFVYRLNEAYVNPEAARHLERMSGAPQENGPDNENEEEEEVNPDRRDEEKW